MFFKFILFSFLLKLYKLKTLDYKKDKNIYFFTFPERVATKYYWFEMKYIFLTVFEKYNRTPKYPICF